jgi:hypothetical protein
MLLFRISEATKYVGAYVFADHGIEELTIAISGDAQVVRDLRLLLAA